MDFCNRLSVFKVIIGKPIVVSHHYSRWAFTSLGEKERKTACPPCLHTMNCHRYEVVASFRDVQFQIFWILAKCRYFTTKCEYEFACFKLFECFKSEICVKVSFYRPKFMDKCSDSNNPLTVVDWLRSPCITRCKEVNRQGKSDASG